MTPPGGFCFPIYLRVVGTRRFLFSLEVDILRFWDTFAQSLIYQFCVFLLIKILRMTLTGYLNYGNKFTHYSFIQLCADSCPTGTRLAHNCMNSGMGKPISVISISCKSDIQQLWLMQVDLDTYSISKC